MKRVLQAWAMVLCIVCMAGSLMAADLPRVMFLGEDDDRDAIPRNSRVHDRVLNAMVNEMLNQGFDVKDETAMTLDTHIQGRKRRSDAELISIAKDAGMDVAVIFTIYPDLKKSYSTVKASARVTGRMLDVYSGSRMGNFEVESQQYQPLQRPYSRNDIIEGVGKIAKLLGRDVGAELAQRLAGYVDQEGGQLIEWTLIFDGFTADDMMEMEDYLVIFSGYDSHRPKKNALNTSTHHEYLYKSSIDSAKLKRNFTKALKKMNMRGRVYTSGNEVKVVKSAKVRQRRVKKQSEW
ncbi:MAG: hypothetical protein CSA21_02335 [Deltaproteobacteria bacterium]|nr:MAG: hypothetical protein CSA21_02335 [Deltaproteobacteria bacterium]